MTISSTIVNSVNSGPRFTRAKVLEIIPAPPPPPPSPPPPGVAEPYTWYTALDKATVPFHASAGAWGPQFTIQEASAPTGTLTSVTVTTFTEFRNAVLAGSRVIT